MEQQQRIGASNSEQLLTILQEQQGSSFWDVVRLDESWFYLHTDHERIWLASDNAGPHRGRQTRDRIESYGMDTASHTPDSPDLAPADFSLFGYLKDRLH
jgi:hypothetical protein